MAINKLSRPQFAAVYAILFQHCRKGEDGYAVYEDGWNDERVAVEARAANPEPERLITNNAVEGVRRDCFGRFRLPGNGDDKTSLRLRVGQLETRVAELEETLRTTLQWMQRRFQYTPPPGRPRSTPPGLDLAGGSNGSA